MSEAKRSRLSTAVKVGIIKRIESGEGVSAVAAETGVLRKSIYEWRSAHQALGVAGLNRRRGPKPGGSRKAAPAGDVAPSGAPSVATPPAGAQPTDPLARANARIGELERVIGRQQVDLHFFQEALRLLDTESRNGAASNSTASSSK